MADILLNIAYDDSHLSTKNSKSDKPKILGKRKREEQRGKSVSSQVSKRPKLTHLGDTSSAAPVAVKKKPQSIVSSLFTSNPTLPNLSIKDALPETDAAPSNAPLKDSSTFEGLGLDRLLINHLQFKMAIEKPTSIQRASLPYLLKPYDAKAPPRDVFLQSQTGSGKTLAFLLPIIQDLLPLSSLSYIDRTVGTLAIIIAPTRELAKQISDVLEDLLKLRLRETRDVPEDNTEPRRNRWLVSGLLSGGATRTHEKARLRKGLPILVATPGRLLDHLQNTTSFDVAKCRWLVLDEADRLMELGFEETIQGILKGIDGRRRLSMKASEESVDIGIGGWEWRERRTILCSATIREDVQKLAGQALRHPVVIKGDAGEVKDAENKEQAATAEPEEKLTPPSQLAQKYIITPLKLRLVTLVALLRFIISTGKKENRGTGSQIIVFLSCTDSVDFHWTLFGEVEMSGDEEERGRREEKDMVAQADGIRSPLFPETTIYKLHGSMPLSERLASLRGFSQRASTSKKAQEWKAFPEHSSILFCTSVASRGLDLPRVRAVVQYDLPTEGGATEYIHRVGRTARAGKGGEAWSFVAPNEAGWVPWVEERMKLHSEDQVSPVKLGAVDSSFVLRKGFGGKGAEYEDRATEVQLAFERWVLGSNSHADLARDGFTSHLRAYATHPSDEKHIFHIKNLHYGHLAKAFALREAPSRVTRQKSGQKHLQKQIKAGKRRLPAPDSSEDDQDISRTEKRMKEVVRSQGRLTKKGGVLMSTGASEFQIASSDALVKMVPNSNSP